ncbi:MAG: hypothetical protein GY839_02195 [candidate division Zixibacteria bacterium]|nr:hypothetical protein [candidate division Zixibacteria bacterium]
MLKKVLILAVSVCFSTLISATSMAHELNGSFKYIYPLPDAKLIAKETSIILKPGELLDTNRSNFGRLAVIEGSISGEHSYQAIVSADNKTIILKPHYIFKPGETVTVSIDHKIKTSSGRLTETGSFRFKISAKSGKLSAGINYSIDFPYDECPPFGDNLKTKSDTIPVLNDDPSLPSDFPDRTITISDQPDSGYLFLSISGMEEGKPYLMILDNSANPVFFRQLQRAAHDFKVQPNGLITYFDQFPNHFYAMDHTYTIVDSIKCADGYEESTDSHDIQMLDNGHVLLLARDPQVIDMSEIIEGGAPEAVVYGLVIQELDIMRNVVWQWRSWDHFEITDATWDIDLLANSIDYVHANAIELADDGNILLSSRHMDEITKIDYETGEIIWRFGGENNEFTLVGDHRWFSHQHDIRELPNGNLTLFDNGNLNTPQYSRAVEYQLDEPNRIATLIWKYQNNPDIISGKMGNHQRLAGGNSIIGWGRGNPMFTEVKYSGDIAFELALHPRASSYRAFRFPWTGNAAKPYLVVEHYEESIHLVFHKFGDTTVVKYYIYAGETPQPSTVIDSTSENYIDLTDLPKGITYFRITALDGSGGESLFSNEEIMDVDLPNKYLPGDANMANGTWPPSIIGADVTYLVNFFRSMPSSQSCLLDGFWCSADANGDCQIIGGDVTKLVNYFRGFASISFCPDYQPAWPTPDDLPTEAPDDWPNCD